MHERASWRIIPLMPSFSRASRWSALLLLPPLLGCGSGGTQQGRRQNATSRQAVASRQPAASAKPKEPRAAPPDAQDFSRDMVTAHNLARSRAQPAPKPALPPLAWSTQAERKASSWAKACKFEHNPNRGDFGENLAAATPGAWTTSQVVKSWADESADYDYRRNTCQKGKVCGHYTQVVWRKTAAVGCATVMCNKNSPFGAKFPTWQLWVCNYAPPGNWVGQRPY
ncbi:CAP domain-containing protein [Myxococcus sp. NMCA1]|uniref:CAP domain-containing protein n=1 Tax=Myxococcus sp. NMCA1 TaxID=2996785 RepID=UPI0022859D95|nr:CAP domain-containing protein [Myxococcus sp. NMCA1]WAM26162.1 CAP domain-containing protein [Myxococcus sp. NMCA1]